MSSPQLRSINPSPLRGAMARRLYRRSVATGQVTLPAVPGMLDEYVTMCDGIFASLGVQFTAEELARLKSDIAARELGQQCYTTIFTRSELANAARLLPLELVADDSVYEYERTHLPDGAWPPASWYANWVSGLDVFDVEREASPIEMRWLVCQKPGSGARSQA